MNWRCEIVPWSDLQSALTQASTDGWALVGAHLHETGGVPVFYVIWSKVA